MLVQLLQVVLAPVPGEATGFIGGYLFGWWAGFVYSTIALTIGSVVNFCLARLLGYRFVRRAVPEEKRRRFDRLLRRQAALVVLALFILPGFPKDYLSLLLGLTGMPLRLFALLAFIGRMPGTLMLSLQGAFLFQGKLVLLAVTLAVCLALVLPVWCYRQRLYRWVEKISTPRGASVDPAGKEW